MDYGVGYVQRNTASSLLNPLLKGADEWLFTEFLFDAEVYACLFTLLSPQRCASAQDVNLGYVSLLLCVT